MKLADATADWKVFTASGQYVQIAFSHDYKVTKQMSCKSENVEEETESNLLILRPLLSVQHLKYVSPDKKKQISTQQQLPTVNALSLKFLIWKTKSDLGTYVAAWS